MSRDDNMSLWHEVYSTDPTYTKQYKGPGGFQGTAISSLYPVQRATEVFGPLGAGWGYEIMEESFIPGAPIVNEQLGVIGQEQTHSLKVLVWAKWQGERLEAVHYGLTPHIYSNKYGVTTDHEAQKKSLTDALKKALTMFGFSADVYMGMHDDPEYMKYISDDYAVKKADNKDEEVMKQAKEYEEWLAKNLKMIGESVSMSMLEGVYKSAMRRAMRHNDTKGQKKLTDAKDEKKGEFEGIAIAGEN